MTTLEKQQKTPLLTGNNSDEKRAEIKRYFENSWQTYESLFSLINADEAYFLRPEPLRHPLVFYYGHTATFYINKLMLGKYISTRINDKLEAICAVGVDEMSWDDLDSRHYDWPSVEEVRNYRQQVYQLMLTLIDDMPLELPISQDSLAWVVLMGCEHERIHLETSSVIMRMLPLTFLSQSPQWQSCSCSGEAPSNELVSVNGNSITLGKKCDDPTYGWDNEFGQLITEVDDFNTSKYLVSNQEYLAFVNADGYGKPHYWTAEGQRWLSYKQPTMPRFWFKRDGTYWQRNLLNEIPLPANWPVEVNYLEAKAFCQWKSEQDKKYIRLPTEAEWYCLRDKIPDDAVDWVEAPGNINLEYFASSSPIDRFENQGVYDICGNVWQWTESAIDGFNGFNVHPLYDDFSTPTFDGQHNLIKGGSWISTGNEAIKSSRYAFRRHFFQHAGFRYVESEHQDVPTVAVNQYEKDITVCHQLASHYSTTSDQLSPYSDYINQLSSYVTQVCQQYSSGHGRLLNLGCSVGGLSFALSPLFDHVDGIDFSARFIQHGVKLQQDHLLRFQRVIEGDIVDFHEVSLPREQSHQNILFSQGDAVNLKSIFTQYDVVILQEVLERSYDPKKVLENIHLRLNSAGVVIIVSDFIFNEEITAKEKWLGGLKVNGENVTGFEGMSLKLSKHFSMKEQITLTKSTSINRRQSLQNTMSVSVWQLKND